MHHKTGFTLVELIIVIAIMAVLIGIAVPIYNDHLNESRTVKVLAHYDTAIKTVRSHAALITTQQARGIAASLPADTAAWISIIDPDSTAVSPTGSAAYAATVNDANGVVGVSLSGTQVTITRPKYASIGGDPDNSDANITTVINLN